MTTHYTKTDLENFIFARAARVHATVDGVRGELVSPAGDACLQVLICVYNAFFTADNRQFLQEEPAPEPAFWRVFAAAYHPPPLARACGVPFFRQDFEAGLFWAAAGGVSGSQKTARRVDRAAERKTFNFPDIQGVF